MAEDDTHDRRPRLAATLSPLIRAPESMSARTAFERLSRLGYRGAQLSATDEGLRPRDLSMSARRDLAATLARHELVCSGIDFLIPAEHFSDPAHAARAFDAAVGAIGLAAALGRAPVVVPPLDEAPAVAEALAAEATRQGVAIASNRSDRPTEPWRACVDCAASLAAGHRPDEQVLALGSFLGAVRVVDLTRSGMRAPIGEPGEARLDVTALRVALEVVRFQGLPVVDARQWLAPLEGIERSIARWMTAER